jgi:DNA-directed RNA polymerase specialized sigma24 family protein
MAKDRPVLVELSTEDVLLLQGLVATVVDGMNSPLDPMMDKDDLKQSGFLVAWGAWSRGERGHDQIASYVVRAVRWRALDNCTKGSPGLRNRMRRLQTDHEDGDVEWFD